MKDQYSQARVFVCGSYGRSRRQFGISGLHGGGRVAFSSVRFAGVGVEGSSRNDSQLHNSALVRFGVKVGVIVDGAW